VIELLDGLPDEVVGFEAVGEVSASDYEDVLTPAVERALSAHGKIRLVHILGDRFDGHTASALWDDAKLGLHVRSYERIAVVTDLRHFRALVRAAGVALPVDVRLFSNAERREAEAWVSEGLENLA
jgi:hypothetical protein